ncbi:MAG: glycoside hydrolase family 15 protein [Mycobacteriales bacterium]
MTSPPIAAHRLLGDGSSTALLRPAGEVDWWCAPEMDDPPVLWSLLDGDGAAARWVDVRLASSSGRAAGPALDTVLHTARGRLECRDGLHCAGDRGSSLIRLVRGIDEDLDLVHELSLGGFDQPWSAWDGAGTTVAERKVRVLGGDSIGDGRVLRTRMHAGRGEWTALVVTFDPQRTADIATLIADLDSAVREDDELLDSAILPKHSPERARDALRVLRMCTYAKTGAVIAAPTTSLPEAPGYGRQWDYRFSWLRDASLAVSVASLLGRRDLAESYLAFVLDMTKERKLPSGPMTTVRGQDVPAERSVSDVVGWGGSLPVRIGNDAKDQVQYDALGLLVEAVSVYLQEGGGLHGNVWELVRAIADDVSGDNLDREISGIWELRDPRPLISADIGVWLALDRAIWIARGWRPRTRRRHWIKARRAARNRVLAALQDDGGLPQSYGDGERSADASALMAVVFRMLDRRDPRASRLVDATVAALDAAPFLYRYEPGDSDGFDGIEGAFLPASWWVVSALAGCGRLEEAEERARALDRALPALMPEEMDPESRQGLGNAPLVWSHMEAARAMYLLDSATVRARVGPWGLALWRLARWWRARRR